MTTRSPRVLICDDSRLLRRLISDMLTQGGLEVVGTAADGAELVDRVAETKPDVVTLDVEMPRMDGLAALRALMAVRPTPVVMVSSLTAAGARVTAEALATGAVDAVQKPSARAAPGAWSAAQEDFVARIVAASHARVGKLARNGGSVAPQRARGAIASRAATGAGPLVVIATSTGGPRALADVIPHLPARLGAGLVIVQHMPEGFTTSLAKRLDDTSPMRVREAQDGDRVHSGTALMAPGGHHLELDGDVVRLLDTPPIGALRPRADVTLSSAARSYGRDVLAVVLTGMGNDGEAGCRDVVRAGGRVLAEDEETSVVWGMPRAVARAGLADAVVPLPTMPLAIAEAVATRR